ncbi:SRPBCC family protein [Spirosoma aerophilum]
MAYCIEAPPTLIEASAEQIWQILTDLDRYPDWNPMTFRVESDLRPGGPVVLHVRMNERYTRIQHEILTDFDPPYRLGWRPTMPAFLLKANRIQQIEPLGERQSRYRTWETFSGPMAPLVMFLFRNDIQRGFNAVATALKRYAEQQYLSRAN